jgi:hypothetical protein
VSRLIKTTHGLKDESDLARTVGFEDRPDEFVVWLEFRLPAHADCVICANPENPQPIGDSVLVRRDAHVILKQPSVAADAIAGGF